MSSTLPYSVSTGSSAFNAFEKLPGIKNYADWVDNVQMMLLSLQQWELVDRTVACPVLNYITNVTQEATDIAMLCLIKPHLGNPDNGLVAK